MITRTGKTRSICGVTVVLAVLLLGSPVMAKVQVVATLEDLGWIAQRVGGDDVEVEVLCPGRRDPHTLPAKPSLARKMKKADLLIYNGLELEVGWLPLLMDAARNPKIRPGKDGELDCSLALAPGAILDVPLGEVDRSQGDIHPFGNPHYLLDPRQGMAVAQLIAGRLALLDPDAEEDYHARADLLVGEIEDLLEDWMALTAALPSRKIIVYHQQWEYLAEWLDLEIIGIIENRPGISPSPRHVEDLVKLGRREGPVVVVAATWDHIDGAARVAEKIGAPLAILPASTLALDEVTGYLGLFDFICGTLGRARVEP